MLRFRSIDSNQFVLRQKSVFQFCCSFVEHSMLHLQCSPLIMQLMQ